MKKTALVAALGSLALAQPALAQDAAEQADVEIALESEDSGQDDEELDPMALAMVSSIFATMFQAEPLTPEAEARLPQASAVAASLVPEGVYGEMMGQMMDSFLSPIMELAEADGGAMSAGDLTEYTGLYGEDLEGLSQEERGELTQIFDPVYETRTKAQFDMIIGVANSAFSVLEPGVREGLAKAYASRFEASELAALNAFFATPVGGKYASQSLVINTDPQVISGMMQAIPALMEQLPMLLESIEDAEAGLPEPRGYDDLTPAEQRRAAQLLGVDQLTLRESMAEADMMTEDAAAADAEANMDAMGDAFDDAFDGEADGAQAAGDGQGGDTGAE
ncbi:DUF2059 domain-containing protein [Citromicrobium bathyomarinum]|uniref:DUF2059 domain-containing protein n=1 Tax=Sphingomonadales TaxID=204457 RepID=UPI000C52CD0B|nr:hypothetical protein [Citromicrobium sp.]|tara:strand:- start:17595 stop:18602 length:1008 start_codon:yes stop_codon:yes gene_type:complete